MAILALGVLLAAFLMGLVLGGPYIRLLRRLRMGKQVRREGPPSHLVTKQGMVTMGGVLFIFVVSVLWLLVLIALPPDLRDDYLPQTIVPIGTLIAVGILGFIDDYVNVVYGFGIRGRHKLVWQAIVAIAAAQYIQRHFNITGVYVPLVGEVIIGPFLFVLLAVFAIVAMSNGVNLTDGLDGLASGACVMIFFAYTLVNIWQYNQSCAYVASAGPKCYEVRDPYDLAVVAVALAAACFGFLWWNAEPAKIFMGDTGSLSLGGALAGLAIFTRTELLLIILGGLLVIEVMSVVLQVGYFKLTHGKRIFKMSPIHHHFELLNWAQVTIVMRFWIIAGLFVAAGLGIFYAEWVSGNA
jgi:phospho-N-acetylmuramoyl-pentapeptide-transferase